MRLALLIPLLATVAAAPPPGRPRPLGQPQHVGRFTVTPLRIVEDSRCPMNARCVRAGRVVVSAKVRDGIVWTMRRFVLGEPAEPGVVLDGVTPARTAGGRAIWPADYRVHFSPLAPD